jgi:hypothetical protein
MCNSVPTMVKYLSWAWMWVDLTYSGKQPLPGGNSAPLTQTLVGSAVLLRAASGAVVLGDAAGLGFGFSEPAGGFDLLGI